MLPREVGKLARLCHLVHAVNVAPDADEGSMFSGNALAGRFCCGHESGFLAVAWGAEGVVAVSTETGEPNEPVFAVFERIEREAPALGQAITRLRSFFAVPGVTNLVNASYWATSERTSAPSLVMAGAGRQFEWLTRSVAEPKAWARSDALTFRAVPPLLLDLAIWLYDVSADRRHVFSEEEHMSWQRKTDDTTLRAVANLAGRTTQLAAVGIDWRATTPSSGILEPPSPTDRLVVGERTVALHEAVALGDSARVESLLDDGGDVDATGWSHELGLPACRPLTVAKERSDSAMLLGLLARGASPILAWSDEYIRWLASADADVGPAVLAAALREAPDLMKRSSRRADR